MRPLPTTKIPTLENMFQPAIPVYHHPIRIHSHSHDIDTPRLHRLYGVHIHKFLAQDTFSIPDPITILIPDIRQCLDGLGEAIRGTACQDHFWPACVGDVWVQVFADKLADEGEERWVALCSAILQGSG